MSGVKDQVAPVQWTRLQEAVHAVKRSQAGRCDMLVAAKALQGLSMDDLEFVSFASRVAIGTLVKLRDRGAQFVT